MPFEVFTESNIERNIILLSIHRFFKIIHSENMQDSPQFWFIKIIVEKNILTNGVWQNELDIVKTSCGFIERNCFHKSLHKLVNVCLRSHLWNYHQNLSFLQIKHSLELYSILVHFIICLQELCRPDFVRIRWVIIDETSSEIFMELVMIAKLICQHLLALK